MLTKREKRIASLEANLGEIEGKDLEVASSLLSQFRRRGKLSEAQWNLVGLLLDRWL